MANPQRIPETCGSKGLDFPLYGCVFPTRGGISILRKGRNAQRKRVSINLTFSKQGFQTVKRFILLAAVVSILGTGTSFAQVDTSPLKLEPTVAFGDLKWKGWSGETENGLPFPLRPILLTNAGDGSNRLFVPQQQGIIHVFKPDSKETEIFLDLSKKVVYIDKENEEGFLGMAFHPKYKTNGEFFVYYTTTDSPHTTVVSRWKVSKDNPNKADANSEEVILSVSHPYWNHKGGTICFGPDGLLYIAIGDGGAGNDPHNNGQNLQSLLGKVLRIDVDHKDQALS